MWIERCITRIKQSTEECKHRCHTPKVPNSQLMATAEAQSHKPGNKNGVRNREQRLSDWVTMKRKITWADQEDEKINPGRPKAKGLENPTKDIILLPVKPQMMMSDCKPFVSVLLKEDRNHQPQDSDSCWKESLPPQKHRIS